MLNRETIGPYFAPDVDKNVLVSESAAVHPIEEFLSEFNTQFENEFPVEGGLGITLNDVRTRLRDVLHASGLRNSSVLGNIHFLRRQLTEAGVISTKREAQHGVISRDAAAILSVVAWQSVRLGYNPFFGTPEDASNITNQLFSELGDGHPITEMYLQEKEKFETEAQGEDVLSPTSLHTEEVNPPHVEVPNELHERIGNKIAEMSIALQGEADMMPIVDVVFGKEKEDGRYPDENLRACLGLSESEIDQFVRVVRTSGILSSTQVPFLNREETKPYFSRNQLYALGVLAEVSGGLNGLLKSDLISLARKVKLALGNHPARNEITLPQDANIPPYLRIGAPSEKFATSLKRNDAGVPFMIKGRR